MMNNEQLQKQINAKPGSGTMLAKLLAERAKTTRPPASNCSAGCWPARRPHDELRIALRTSPRVGERGAAFEDLLWSLVNSAEFTTRR